ncbi:M14 metallopeptidase family protein [Flavihumibacter cheonanensis]|uniref:M14 metallopeptidase family protein n=1 Tax=Flavihumibacter cheonanensis TaxID=1442385 RepID=UPI001EF8A04A|nr:M14 metallopeptidase family protein [Flavihumibacter cheonanensis]MCG7752336.1 M14 family metallopeptidase [Flavihumibacter cheonanensis]
MRRLICLAGVLLVVSGTHAQLKSPEAFLGYKVGTHYTPHYRIVQYFQHLAKEAPQQLKLEQYGETNEGRPLLLATIASTQNMSNIEAIRTNNLRLANSTRDKAAPNENAPAIVWLSYNVHGNETSSSEAAMLTAYELVNPSNSRSQQWLQNTVVLIDPCLNPDGRDRYVNWYTTVIGQTINPEPIAREHREPWPGGRSNHYNFDLNRDWAWQTQKESQHRLKVYNTWLPQVHVDFHEQGVNEPYYFAPAAEPFHEVITPWQREFQTMIGKNHARYFDKEGWLYFTKERFDLFYPSYGDTYPTYHGAIGMTYEQGGIRAGLGIINEDGDTLTLVDRVQHHFTTGISTVEITSQHAARVVKEFRNYFTNVLAKPAGEFKSWVIKNDGTDRVSRLTSLLDKNLVDWSYASSASYSGLNYFTGKSESFKAEPGDIVINLNQPKGNFVKVLFERNSAITDSATYDITAWSMPYVYGLKAYGVTNFITATTKTTPAFKDIAVDPNAYAYAIKWDGLNSAKFLAAALKKGLKVRFTQQPFQSGNQNFEKGSLLVTKAANSGKDILKEVQQIAAETQSQLYSIPSGFVDKGYDFGSSNVRIINAPKVALLAGENISSLGFGELWHFFDTQLKYPVTVMSANDFIREGMNTYDVLILADGSYDFFNKKELNDDLKAWVRRGGKIIALENAVAQMARADWGIKMKDGEDKKSEGKSDYSVLRKFENRERDWLKNSMPGSIFRLELDNTHPLGFGYPDYYYSLKQDGNLYEFFKEDGWNVGVIKRDNYVSGFAGSDIRPKLNDALLIGAQDMGRGQVIYFADNPIFRSFWENGKLLLCNALFLTGQ